MTDIPAKYHVCVYIRGRLQNGDPATALYACLDYGFSGGWLIMDYAYPIHSSLEPLKSPSVMISYQHAIPSDIIQSVDVTELP